MSDKEIMKCVCEDCGHRFLHTIDKNLAVLPHEPRPISCPECSSIEIEYIDIGNNE